MININTDKCIGCGQCVKDCFPRDIEVIDGKAVIKNVNCIKCGHCIAVCPKHAVSTDEYNMDEVKEYDKETFQIHDEHLLNFIKFRRTTRQFKNKDVENELLEKIIEAGRYTQTGRNLQDVSYIIVKEGIEELKALVLKSLKGIGENILANPNPQTIMYKPYAELWLKMYKEFKEKSIENDRLFFHAPVVLIVTAQSDVSGALASSNMELMTNALGLGTFFSGFTVRAAMDNLKISEFLGLAKDKKVVTCMVIGYPNVKYFRSVPRKIAEISWK
ncbi:MAG: nitroreductase family protein [Clostridiales bacterium]